MFCLSVLLVYLKHQLQQIHHIYADAPYRCILNIHDNYLVPLVISFYFISFMSQCEIMFILTYYTLFLVSQQKGDQASIIGGVVEYISELQQVLQSLEAKKERKTYAEVLSPRLVPSPRPSPPVLSPRKPPISPRISHQHLLLHPISPRTPLPTSPYGGHPPQLPLIPQPPRSYSLGDPPPYSPASSSSSPSVSSNHESSLINELVANSKSALADVEVKFSGANVLLKTVSHKIPGQVLKIIAALEDLALEILQVNINTVNETMLNSFTIKVRSNNHPN